MGVLLSTTVWDQVPLAWEVPRLSQPRRAVAGTRRVPVIGHAGDGVERRIGHAHALEGEALAGGGVRGGERDGLDGRKVVRDGGGGAGRGRLAWPAESVATAKKIAEPGVRVVVATLKV